ncbi:hypothetical protein BH23PLA1_BH23PLA1_13160 [soil metagenome]
MTGLNLELFLHLLRADIGAWVSLALIVFLLGLMAWTSWGSRRALRKCLVLSVVVHVGVMFFGNTNPLGTSGRRFEALDSDRSGIRQIRVTPLLEGPGGGPQARPDGRPGSRPVPAWDRPGALLAPMADPVLRAPRPELEAMALARATLPGELPPPEPSAAPSVSAPVPETLEDRPLEPVEEPLAAPVAVAPEIPGEIAESVRRQEEQRASPILPGDPMLRLRLRPEAAPTADSRPDRRSPDLAVLPDRTPEPDPEPNEPEPNSVPEPAAETRSDPLPEVEPMAPVASAEGIAEPRPPLTEAVPDRSETLPGGSDLREAIRPPLAEQGGERRPEVSPAVRPPLLSLSDSGPSPTPEPEPETGSVVPPEDRPEPSADSGQLAVAPMVPSGVDPEGIAEIPGPTPNRSPIASAAPDAIRPEANTRLNAQPDRPDLPAPGRELARAGPVDLQRAIPSGLPDLPVVRGATGGRPLSDVPEVYRPRLDPNRSARARASGASAESEQAVERALNWLDRPQDADGRWDAGTARHADGTPAKGEDSFTSHCPPGDTCHGECYYWEADTAVTGLSLLAFLGAGYTHTDGKYAGVVAKGLEFLLLSQKPDGDLRGRSRAVGMYCHAVAALALCAAYALSGDPRLKDPVERAVAFTVKAQYPGGMAWRYAPAAEIVREPNEDRRGWNYKPHAPIGDTSVLGWIVLVLKSAAVVGIDVPASASRGAQSWLERVALGDDDGLASYLPGQPETPTMTAEAWVCRQFLGIGAPGPASTEAARFLLENAPSSSEYNIYYWYYGTLAMYQNGGEAWLTWNDSVRDELVRRQHLRGHKAGSWDPDETPYGSKGGRIYTTALAALSLEVYYRYLRLYEDPAIAAPVLSPAPARPADPTMRRAGTLPADDRR